jgi:hypothetical protein
VRLFGSLVLFWSLALVPVCAGQDQGGWQRITPTRRRPVMSMSIDGEQPRPTRAMRLIFEYEGDRVRLVSEQPVEMAVTGFDLPRGPEPGFYVDTRDQQNRTLARVPARGAFATSMEVFPEAPGEPITRVDVAHPRGAFTVVVPAPETTDHVTVMQISPGGVRGVPGGPGVEAAGPLEEVDLASFPLGAAR